MDVLVTGGAGFIGSHLTAALLSQGARVRVLDNLSSGSLVNLTGCDVTFIEGNIKDLAIMQSAVNGCEIVFHQAAMVSIYRSIQDPVLNHYTNVTGTFNVFEAARLAGVRRVIYASSAAVYGNLPGLPKHEDDLLAPQSPYAVSKQINELLASSYTASYGMELVGLRYMNVFGPRQDPFSPYSGVLPIFCRAATDGMPCTIYGDGEQSRDFIYVADVVRANLLAADLATNRLPFNPVFNVGCGIQTTLNHIVTLLEKLVGRQIPVVYQDPRPGDIRHSVADIYRAQTILGFQPEVKIKAGLKATLEWVSGKTF